MSQALHDVRNRVRALVAATMMTIVVMSGVGSAVGLGPEPRMSAASAPPLGVGGEIVVSRARPGTVHLEPAVAWNGKVFLVVWTELRPFEEASRIYATRVTPAGRILDPRGMLISTDEVGPNPNSNARVAAGNGRFLVVWEEDRSPNDIRGAMVGGGGAVLRKWFVSLGEDHQGDPDVAWNGEQFFVAWTDEVDGEPFDIHGTRVRWSGRTLDGCNSDVCDETAPGHGIAVSGSAPGAQRDPAIAALRRGPAKGLFLVTWTDQNDLANDDVRGGRLTSGGRPLDDEGFLVSGAAGSQSDSELTTNQTRVLSAWTDTRHGTGADIFATRLRVTGVPAARPSPQPPSGLAVSDGVEEQTGPTIARRGEGFLVAWTDARSGTSDVFAARIQRGGANLDPTGVPIAATPRDEARPALAAGRGKILMAYERDVLGSRYDGRSRLFLRLVR